MQNLRRGKQNFIIYLHVLKFTYLYHMAGKTYLQQISKMGKNWHKKYYQEIKNLENYKK